MTSDRVYRGRLTDDEAIAELDRCSGTQFDPDVVAALADELGVGDLRTRRPQSPPSPQPALLGSGTSRVAVALNDATTASPSRERQAARPTPPSPRP